MTTTTGDRNNTVHIDAMNEQLAENWWMLVLRGAAAILFGLICFFWPGVSWLSIVLLFAIYSFADGVLAIYQAIHGARRKDERWGWMLLSGVLGVIVAVLAVLWPGITVFAFVMLVAAWALLTGALMLATAMRLKRNHGRGWLIFGGIVSAIYACLLIIAPLIGALVLIWWIGAHALVLGVTEIALAFRLRSRHNDNIGNIAAHAAS